MIVARTDKEVAGIHRSVVSVGNFDGVHRGHRLLIQAVKKRAERLKAVSVVVTFEPHTRAVLHPNGLQAVLTTTAEKELLLSQLGVDILVVLEFTKDMAAMSPEQFIDSVLIQRLKAAEWVMGENHAFGRQRSGTKNFLHQNEGRKHFRLFAISLSRSQSDVISSTQIRSLVLDGMIREAAEMLGVPYLIMAQRVQGTHTGTSLGFPTLNFKLPPSQKVLPPAGAYAARLSTGTATWQGALYVGNCPTFKNRDYHLEFYALEGDGSYPQPGENAALWAHEFIRGDETFANAEALVAQVTKDVAAIERYFGKRKE